MITESTPRWLAARAGNAIRRPVFVFGVSIGVLITTLVAIIAIPQQRRQVQSVSMAALPDMDTLRLRDAIAGGRTRLAAAESTLSETRSQALAAATRARAAADSVSPAMVARRDSLAEALADLQALMTTAETAPLPSSYRALASSPALAGNARVRATIDSLTEVERERDAVALAGGGGADPIFVALTSRVTELGQVIQAQAEQRRDDLRTRMAAVPATGARRIAATMEAADTIPWIAERDSARSAIVLAEEELGAARARLQERDEQVMRAQAAAAGIAPAYAFLGAAIVFGMMIGFGAAFFSEVRRPRVADAADAERATSLRVLATIGSRAIQPERMRRQADRSMPSFIDPAGEAYQLIYLYVARQRVAAHVMLTIAGDDPRIAAIVAANLAAIAAEEARTVVVVDAHGGDAALATALGVRPRPGVTDVAQGAAGWADATRSAELGRGRVIDVVPTGSATIDSGSLHSLIKRDSSRLTRYYDAIFVTASLDTACSGLPLAMPIPAVVVCARAGHTDLRDLAARVEALRLIGAEPLGIVLWNTEVPVFVAPRPTRGGQGPGAPLEALVGGES